MIDDVYLLALTFDQYQSVFFPFFSNFYCKIQSEGLQHQYMADSIFSYNVKMLVALAFVPLSDVVNAFNTLVAEMPEQLDPIIDYFEKNYIGVAHRRGRRPPRFPLELWNVMIRLKRKFQEQITMWKVITDISRHNLSQVTCYILFLYR